ncbi:zinc finger protein 358-like isoform X1 [Eriocheir sinensis]|uniref:zinc finger protein 358-like isoform X1 n=1 Tax=Eriocheir sinensis TaxID=95602 RepID=UPI0021C868EF|nr:zinc finger protein 358-like isoform X1 [Eriocheir sinensis]
MAGSRAELCRLCGGQEGKLLHLHDTFSTLGTSSTILQLLHSISVFLKVQAECEALMPHHLCWTCFNTAVDISAFIDSGINFQRTTANHFLSSLSTSIEAAPCDPLLLPLPSSGADDQEIVLQGELEEEQEVVLGTASNKAGASILAVAEEEAKLQECYPEPKISLNKSSDVKIDEDKDASLHYFFHTNQMPDEAGEAITVIEELTEKSQEFQESTNIVKEGKGDQHQGSKQISDADSEKEEDQGSTQVLKEEVKKPSPGNEREKCPHCSKTFLRQSQLKSHLVTHSEARPHQCTVCGVAFKYRRNLVEHTHTHSQQPSFICAVCGLTFKQKSNLLKHERTHRKGSKLSYRCKVCDSLYSQSSHLKTHMKNAHGDNPGFRCDQCSVVLLCRSSLRRHLATVHASTTRFTCPHCSKGFNNQQNYHGHVRSHTGERPYKCLVCPKAFTTPKALSRHRMVHRGTKAHKCAQCGKAFLELCDLKRHTKRHLLKSAKRVANQDSATNPPEASVESINLMVLTDSLIFTESQQLLDNPEPRPNQVLLPNGKLNGPKDVSNETVLEGGSTPLELEKKPQVEVLAPGPLLPATPDLGAVLEPPVMGDMAAPLHPSQVLQPTTIDAEVGAGASQVDLVHRECPGVPVASDVPTMVVLASASTPTEFLPDPEPRTGDRTSSPVGDVGERVLSHATW